MRLAIQGQILAISLLIFSGLLMPGFAAALRADPVEAALVWPTANRAFLEGGPLAAWVQPTVSGNLESALYGCVRNEGERFHEGLDIKAVRRDGRGLPRDAVLAAMDGRVVHVNEVAGDSSYGIYIVLEHLHFDLPVYTLYAHLASVGKGITPGVPVRAGQRLGLMGNSAGGYVIPASRAHLHFEIGVRLADTSGFAEWYQAQNYETENRHGPWNGMNLAGIDPAAFYEAHANGRIVSIAAWWDGLDEALTVRVAIGRVPEFLRRHPILLHGVIPAAGMVPGWEIGFDEQGIPLRFKPLLPGEVPEPRVELLYPRDSASINALPACRRMVSTDGGEPRPGASLQRNLELIFPELIR